MIRIFSKTAFICLLMCLSAASAWAVWEGNAGIASSSDFPGAGMYARSDMFPKNTIVDIQNLEKNITIRVVITGPSGIPGLVALLSPETAATLNIRAGSVSRVRISIPSPINERPADGLISGSLDTKNETSDPDINPAVASSGALAVPFSSLTEAAANPFIPLSEASPDAEAVPAAEGESPVVSASETAQEVPASESSFITSGEPTEPSVADTIETPETLKTPESVESAQAESVTLFNEPEIVVVPDETVPETAPEIAPAPFATSDNVSSAKNSSVTLEPAELNPPSVPETPPVTVAVIVSIPPVAPILSKVPLSPVSLPFITSLVKGGFYIQIASYSSPLNAKSVVDSYGNKYPVAVEKSAGSKGEILKVYIGPMQKDEYGAVLERFKTLGFKDAFVKKGQ